MYPIMLLIASKITTTRDTFLLMFPISFCADMIQMVLFTEEKSIGYVFACMLIGQEAYSLLANTGIKDWVVHKILVRMRDPISQPRGISRNFRTSKH